MLFGGIQLSRPLFVGRGLPLLVIGEEFRQRFCLLLRRLCFNDGQAQRLRQPTGAVEKTLGLFGHIALLQMVDELSRRLALCLANRLENAGFGDTAEIVVPTARASTSAWSSRVLTLWAETRPSL